MSIRNLLKRSVRSLRFLRRPSVGYCVANELFPELFVRIPSATLRSALFLPSSPHRTQLNQDVFALVVNRFRRGFFVEIGANDGYTMSNTVYLEEEFGWDGILVEANPRYAEDLSRRKAKSVISAVADHEGPRRFRDAGLFGGMVEDLDERHRRHTEDARDIVVWGTTLERVLKANGAPSLIDFVSIDIEGAETSVVRQMCDLEHYRFWCGCIEHNDRLDDYSEIQALLAGSGYVLVWEDQTGQDLFFVDRQAVQTSG